jgi:hypothetical protein
VFSAPFVEEISFSPVHVLDSFIGDQMAVPAWFVSGSSIVFHWTWCLFLCQYHAVFITMALYYNLKSGIMIPPALIFLLKIVLAI